VIETPGTGDIVQDAGIWRFDTRRMLVAAVLMARFTWGVSCAAAARISRSDTSTGLRNPSNRFAYAVSARSPCCRTRAMIPATARSTA
jgi:hypothetical protein